MKIKLINKAGYHSKIENQNGNYIDIDNNQEILLRNIRMRVLDEENNTVECGSPSNAVILIKEKDEI